MQAVEKGARHRGAHGTLEVGHAQARHARCPQVGAELGRHKPEGLGAQGPAFLLTQDEGTLALAVGEEHPQLRQQRRAMQPLGGERAGRAACVAALPQHVEKPAHVDEGVCQAALDLVGQGALCLLGMKAPLHREVAFEQLVVGRELAFALFQLTAAHIGVADVG